MRLQEVLNYIENIERVVRKGNIDPKFISFNFSGFGKNVKILGYDCIVSRDAAKELKKLLEKQHKTYPPYGVSISDYLVS